MAIKQHKDQDPLQKGQGRSTQDKKGGKQPETTTGANCAGDLEQQASSNKGKGPAGENL